MRDLGGDYEAVDRLYHGLLARQTGGVSPAALGLAFADWATHLALSPGKQAELLANLLRYSYQWQRYVLSCATSYPVNEQKHCVPLAPGDKRFIAEEWSRFPFNIFHQGFLLYAKLWDDATKSVRGVSREHEKAVNFCIRQVLDMFSPSNFVLTNPEIIDRTICEGGMNFLRGAQNAIEDLERLAAGEPAAGTEAYKVGRNIATTPGKVIFRNDLIELIQYHSSTKTVHPEPILIVPAWIMKYYILDLSPHDSLVKYLVDQGFTVFMISWKNPDAKYRGYGMDDYRRLGVMGALNVITKIAPNRKVHAVGYCLGGTLLSIAASAMALEEDDRLKSLSFFAAQTDFSQPGELELFVGESQLAFLEDMMEEHGYLDSSHMAATFQLLRSNDLIWSRILRDYFIGERRPVNDLMAWNADATRMPARMHAEYLRYIYLDNRLAEGRYAVDGRSIAIRDIRVPIFAVGTEWDHVAPWRSVYQINLLADTEVTFLLTNGGHNAGIVSELGREDRFYRVATAHKDEPFIDPDTWYWRAPTHQGSWWPEWIAWLRARSGEPASPPAIGSPNAGYAPICDAPGTYVFE